MRRGLFITGTGTGVGKTAVTAGLARCLVRRGLPIRVMKPIETGLRPNGEPCDAGLLMQAARRRDALDLVCPVRLGPALSPWQASQVLDEPVDLDALFQAFELLSRDGPLLAEGAGGLLAPIRVDYLMADLARDLGLPLLIVARTDLGTLNHTLLTVESAHRRGLAVCGVVLSEPEPAPEDPLASRLNPESLRELLALHHPGTPILAVLPHLPGMATPANEIDDFADCLEASGLADWALGVLGGD